MGIETQMSACAGLAGLLALLHSKFIDAKNAPTKGMAGESQSGLDLEKIIVDVFMLLHKVSVLKERQVVVLEGMLLPLEEGGVLNQACLLEKNHLVGHVSFGGEKKKVHAEFDVSGIKLTDEGEVLSCENINLSGVINFYLPKISNTIMSMCRVWSNVTKSKGDETFDYGADKVFHMIEKGELSCSWQETPGLAFQIVRQDGYNAEIDFLFRKIAVEIYQKGKFAFLVHEADQNLAVLEYSKGFYAQDDRKPTLTEQAALLAEYPNEEGAFAEKIDNLDKSGETRNFYLHNLDKYLNSETPPILKENFAWPEFFGLPNPRMLSFRDIQKRPITGKVDLGGVVYRQAPLPFYKMHSMAALTQVGRVLPEMEKMVENVDDKTLAKFRGAPNKAWLPYLRR